MTLVYLAGGSPCGSFLVWLNISPFAAAGRSAVDCVVPDLGFSCVPLFLWGRGQMWLEVTSPCDTSTPKPALVLPRVMDVAPGS